MSDYDPRLVELYDADNPDGPEHDFYRALANEIGAKSILDLGCGTGILSVTFARPGRAIVGIDPSPNMLAYAKGRYGAENVTWILGDSRRAMPKQFDYAVMTGNVAQHIPESEWPNTLAGLRRALNDEGVLAFESRNPTFRAWTRWAAAEPATRSTSRGLLREWCDADELAPGRIRLTFHNFFDISGDHIIEELTLEFRGQQEIEQELAAAGFTVEAVFGDWYRKPFTDEDTFMVFIARAV